MIEIKVDKRSELEWITRAIGSGVLNSSEACILNFLGVPLQQEVTYKPSDIYEEDITDKIEEFNKRFAGSGLVGWQIEEILRKELLGTGEVNDSAQTT